MRPDDYARHGGVLVAVPAGEKVLLALVGEVDAQRGGDAAAGRVRASESATAGDGVREEMGDFGKWNGREGLQAAQPEDPRELDFAAGRDLQGPDHGERETEDHDVEDQTHAGEGHGESGEVVVELASLPCFGDWGCDESIGLSACNVSFRTHGMGM